MRDTDQFELLFSEKAKEPSTGNESGLYTLSLYEKERSLQIGSMEHGL